MDALLAQEGDHAADGRPVDLGLIMASRDAVALDTVAGAVMGFAPHEVDTTRIAGELGLGEADLARIDVLGEAIEDVRRPFARPDVELSEEKFAGLRLYAGDYCRSCSYYVRRGLDRLKQERLLDEGRPLAVVVGRDPEVPDEFYKTLPIAILMKGRHDFSYAIGETLGYYKQIEIGKPYRYASIQMVMPRASDLIKNDIVIFITKSMAILIVHEIFSKNFRKFI